MHSILANLVENAVKYSPQGSNIKVVLCKNAGRIQLDVMDQGNGIAEADKKRIFEKFYRAGNEETRSAKGTGLGLYIVHYFVKLHGGSIQVLDAPSGGSVFRLVF
jgi:K+-sensing histidine kinase KdpD